MDWLDFIATVIGSLAWPVVVIVIVLVFRRPITGLLAQGVTRLKAGPLEMEWERQVTETRVELEAAGVPATAVEGAGATLLGTLGSAHRRPRVSITDAFTRVEHALRDLLAERAAALDVEGLPALALARAARERGLLSEETVRAVEGLTVLRNLAEHGDDQGVTINRVLEYRALADGVLYAIQSAVESG